MALIGMRGVAFWLRQQRNMPTSG
ncbi:hypothetical protein [Nostoc sp.]